MHDDVTCPKCQHAFSLDEAKPSASSSLEEGEQNDELLAEAAIAAAARPAQAARRGSPLTSLVRAGVVVATFASLAVALFLLNYLPSAPQPRSESAESQTHLAAQSKSAGESGGKVRTPSGSLPVRPTSHGDAFSQVVSRAMESIVKIESVGGGERTLGCGFVVDPRGLIATNYHVVADATRGRVRFPSGAVYEIAGYAAVDPADDLAVLVLRNAPQNLAPLRLRVADDPATMSPVVAIGHPQGLSFSSFDGRVSRMVETADLPEESRRFLARDLQAQGNHRWIQHTAGTSEGNSGGPLINLRGEVVGVNTWVNTDANYSYALHPRYLAQLLEHLSPEAIPLERFASSVARSEAQLERLAVGQIRQLYDQARAMRWRPADEAQYEVLERLAATMTIIGGADDYAAGLIDEQLREQLIGEYDQVEQLLRNERFNDVGLFTIVNDFAAERVGKRMRGLFCFGTVVEVFRGDGDAKAMFVRLAGGDETLFISLTGSLTTPAAGDHCLLLGISSGRTVRYGENPLQPKSAAEIVSQLIVPLK